MDMVVDDPAAEAAANDRAALVARAARAVDAVRNDSKSRAMVLVDEAAAARPGPPPSKKRKLEVEQIERALGDGENAARLSNEQTNQVFRCNTELAKVSLELKNIRDEDKKLAIETADLRRENAQLKRDFGEANKQLAGAMSREDVINAQRELVTIRTQFEENKRMIEVCENARSVLQTEKQNALRETNALKEELNEFERDITRLNNMALRIESNINSRQAKKRVEAKAKVKEPINYGKNPYEQVVAFVVDQAASQIDQNGEISPRVLEFVIRQLYPNDSDRLIQQNVYQQVVRRLQELGFNISSA